LYLRNAPIEKVKQYFKWLSEPLEVISFGGLVVVVANNPRDPPCAVFALPQMNELPFANALCVFMSRVVKEMNTHLDRAIALQGMHLQCPWNEFPCHFAADILLYGIG